MLHAVKDRLDTEVFLLRDGVELVRVTAGAVDGQSEEGLPHDADQVLHLLFTRDGLLRDVGLRVPSFIPRTAHEQAGTDDAVARHRFQHIAGDLLLHEPVVGLVVVEALDDVVAIVPRVVAQPVVLEALALGISRHIQPMPPPSLPVARRRQQPFHQPLVRARRLVRHERIDLRRRRRQTDQVEAQSPDQRGAVGGRREREAVGGETGEDEGVERGSNQQVSIQ